MMNYDTRTNKMPGCECNCKCKCSCKPIDCPSDNDVVLGNSIDVNLDCYNCESEIRADIVMSKTRAVRLWGQIKDCEGEPICNALLKLVKVCTCSTGKYYEGVAHTVSDCEGFYQFDLCIDHETCYKILVGKSTTGDELILNTEGGNCGACDLPGIVTSGPCYTPCEESKKVYKNISDCSCKC